MARAQRTRTAATLAPACIPEQRPSGSRTAGVVGHRRTLALLAGQRETGRLAHAFCFTGDAGIGKTTVARALAEDLLLGTGQPPRLEVHPDCWIDDRTDAISIDEIRFHPEKGAQAHDQSLQQFLSLRPFSAAYRVAILANAERMTEAAQNCLLKTLEEPPARTVLILTTAYPDHLLPTCLSRCQVLPFTPVPRPELVNWLRSVHGAGDAADALAGFARGRPGVALRALEAPDWLTRLEKLVDELAGLPEADAGTVLAYAARFGQGTAADQRVVAGEALSAMTEWLRDALLVQAGMGNAASTRRDRLPALEDWVGRLPADHLRKALAAAQRTQLLIDQNVNPRLAMEVLLLDFRVKDSR